MGDVNTAQNLNSSIGELTNRDVTEITFQGWERLKDSGGVSMVRIFKSFHKHEQFDKRTDLYTQINPLQPRIKDC